MKLADGLFPRCCREVAQEFPEMQYKEPIVDNASIQLVMRPESFYLLLLSNLNGDIVSDLAAGLVGGLGVVPGANMGTAYAVFEAVHEALAADGCGDVKAAEGPVSPAHWQAARLFQPRSTWNVVVTDVDNRGQAY